MSLIEFRNVSHNYRIVNENAVRNVKAINNLTFEIEDKKITAIIGRSGSGKSTLLQIINGLLKPDSGEVLVFGKPLDYKNIYSTRLKIGYSVQGTGLFPHLSVYNNISILGRITDVSKHDIERRTDTLMSFVNLPPEFKTKYPFQLSGGEQQRVGICRAILLNPPVFLLDEAFASLDPETKSEIHDELLVMQNTEPRTIVIVTHDMAEAIKLADNIMILDNGSINQYSSKREILQNPESSFVKAYLNAQRV